MITGNRKVLGSIPSGEEVFLFSQKKLFKEKIKHYLIKVTDIFWDCIRRKIVEVILLNFRSKLRHKDKLEVIWYHCNYL